MQPVADQILSFFLICGLGFAAGFFFDCYRIIRRIWRPKLWGTTLGDAVFWVVLTLFSFTFLLVSVRGEVRFYVFVAISLGVFVYQRWTGKYMRPVIYKAYFLLAKGLKISIIFITTPLVFMGRILLFPFRLGGWLVNSWWSGLKRIYRLSKEAVSKIRHIFRPPPPPPENFP